MILGLPSCRKLNFVTLNCAVSEHLPPLNSKEDLQRLYPDCFKGIGKFCETFHIKLDPAVTPVVHAPRRCPIHMKDDVRNEINQIVELGVKLQSIREATQADYELCALGAVVVDGWPDSQRHLAAPLRPWQIVGTDLFAIREDTYLLICDYYSKFPFVYRIEGKVPSDAIISKMSEVFAENGSPNKPMSDNGGHYSSQAFRNVAPECNVHPTLRSIEWIHRTSSSEVYPEEGSDVEIQHAESTAFVDIHTDRQPFTVTGRDATKCPQVQVEPPRNHQK